MAEKRKSTASWISKQYETTSVNVSVSLSTSVPIDETMPSSICSSIQCGTGSLIFSAFDDSVRDPDFNIQQALEVLSSRSHLSTVFENSVIENSTAVRAQPFYTFRQHSTKRTSGKPTVGQHLEIQPTSEGNFDENNDTFLNVIIHKESNCDPELNVQTVLEGCSSRNHVSIMPTFENSTVGDMLEISSPTFTSVEHIPLKTMSINVKHLECMSFENNTMSVTKTTSSSASGQEASVSGVSFFKRRSLSGDCKKVYDKTLFCTFCSKAIHSKISCHLLTVHKDEVRVTKLLFLPKKSLKRIRGLEILENEGNFKHNAVVLRTGNGMLVVGRRKVCERQSSNPLDYLPCQLCKKYIF